jgi:serine protease Do
MNKYVLLLISIFSISTITIAQTAMPHASPKERTTPTYLSKEETTVSTIYKKVLPAVVTIITSSNNFTEKGAIKSQGQGSGVLISHDCYILTAAHVVDGASEILVKTQDGKMRKANILFSEKTADIALLQLKVLDPTLAHAKLGDSDNLVVGQNVYAIGSPYGLENSFSSGIISAFRGDSRVYDGTVPVEFIQTDAAINPGNSGGPLFNSQGEVVGIASSILTVSGGFQGIGMVVAINTAKDLLAFEDRPWVGVESVFLTQEEYARLFNLPIQNGGLLIQRVAVNSPAAKAGLRGGYISANVAGREILFGGDIILQVGKQVTCHVGCLEKSKGVHADENKVSIRYLREGKEYTAILDTTDTRRNFLVQK